MHRLKMVLAYTGIWAYQFLILLLIINYLKNLIISLENGYDMIFS